MAKGDGAKQQAIEQAFAMLNVEMTKGLYGFMEGCRREGFSRQEAYELTKQAMIQILGGAHGLTPYGKAKNT